MTLYKQHQRFWGSTTAEMYAKWKNQDPWFYPVIDRLLELKPTSLLDAGCGQGISYDRFPDNLRQVYTGIDQVPQMIAFFKQRHPQVNAIIGDITQLNFADNQFDSVICFNTLIYFDNLWLEAIKELFRVTKKTLIFSIRLWDRPDTISDGELIKNYQTTLALLQATFPRVDIGEVVSERHDFIVEITKNAPTN